ncbi:MAG: aspartate aminotransferase family protein, partial [Candidatus Acidiferrales bacterium]
MQAIDQKIDTNLPQLITSLPGPKARQIVERDRQVVSPSYTRDYPMVALKGRGAT